MLKNVALLKLGLFGAVELAVLTSLEAFGLPAGWSVLLNVFFLGWGSHAWISAYVGGMNRPTADSSPAYVHWFNSMHLLFQRSTNPWKIFTKEEGQ